MSNLFKDRIKEYIIEKKYNFPERDYLYTKGNLGETKLFSVHHICIHEDCIVFDKIHFPFGDKDILEKKGEILEEIFNEILPILNKDKERRIGICGEGMGARIFARKLEDRIKREIYYN